MRMEMNQEKSATNVVCDEGVGKQLEGIDGYKYLGVMEDANNMINQASPDLNNRLNKIFNSSLIQAELNA